MNTRNRFAGQVMIFTIDMKEYVEGSYSADKPKGDENAGESRLWKYYEGIRKASTFLDNVDRCPELTMDEIADMKGQARFFTVLIVIGL